MRDIVETHKGALVVLDSAARSHKGRIHVCVCLCGRLHAETDNGLRVSSHSDSSAQWQTSDSVPRTNVVGKVVVFSRNDVTTFFTI